MKLTDLYLFDQATPFVRDLKVHGGQITQFLMRPSVKDVGNLVGGGFNKFLEICHQGEVGIQEWKDRGRCFLSKISKNCRRWILYVMLKKHDPWTFLQFNICIGLEFLKYCLV